MRNHDSEQQHGTLLGGSLSPFPYLSSSSRISCPEAVLPALVRNFGIVLNNGAILEIPRCLNLGSLHNFRLLQKFPTEENSEGLLAGRQERTLQRFQS